MELCGDVWSITIIHDINAGYTSNLYEYKFFPVFQTETLTHLHKTMKMGIVHTPISFYTKFPAVARMMFDASIFVSCDKDHLIEYVNKVTDVFKNTISKFFDQRIAHINDAKSLAVDMGKKVMYVKQAQRKNAFKHVMKQISVN
jgi:hypothetical protein